MFKRWSLFGLIYGLAATMALVGLVLLSLDQFRGPETLLVGIPRKQIDRVPPYRLDSDGERFLGLVLAPFCQPKPEQRPLLVPVAAVAACGNPQSDGAVQVRLGDSVQLGGRPLTVDRARARVLAWFARRIEQGQRDLKIEPSISSGILTLKPRDPDDGPALRSELSTLLLFDGEDCPVGTGRWRAICQASNANPESSKGWASIPASLRESGAVADVTVLGLGNWLTGRRRIVFVGFDYTKLKPAQLGAALDGDSEGLHVHLLRNLSSDQMTGIVDEARAGRAWDILYRSGAQTTWLVANPDEKRLPPGVRERIFARVRRALATPDFYDASAGAPARALLPTAYPPLHFVPLDMESSTDGVDQVDLLTHSVWEPLAKRLNQRDPVFRVKTVATDLEAKQREQNDYDVSMLTVVAHDRSHPARFLVENLPLWFAPDHPLLLTAQSLAKSEALGEPVADELSDLLQKLDAYIVPVSVPKSWFAVRDDLVGWDAATERLDPELVGIRGWINTAPYGAGLVLLALAISVVNFIAKSDRKRRDAMVRQQLEGFHHDLMAPVSSIRNEADALAQSYSALLPESYRRGFLKSAEMIDLEVQGIRLLVDALRIVSAPDPMLSIEQSKTALRSDILEPLLETVRARAQRDDVPLQATLDAPQQLEVAVSSTVLRPIVENLLENAVKYRKPSTIAKVHVEVRSNRRFALVIIEDNGIGFDPIQSQEHFFAMRQRGERAQRAGIPGTGMGLAVAHSLATKIGGRLEIRSFENPTIVALYIPLWRAST